MTKVTFLGAGNIVFAKNVLSDFKQSSALHDCHIALYDRWTLLGDAHYINHAHIDN